MNFQCIKKNRRYMKELQEVSNISGRSDFFEKYLLHDTIILKDKKDRALCKGYGSVMVEVESNGLLKSIRFINKGILDKYRDKNGKLFEVGEIASKERYIDFITNNGQVTANKQKIDFDFIHLSPIFLKNGNMRFLANFFDNIIKRY